MRSMPRTGPAIFERPTDVPRGAVRWDWRHKVYPDRLAVATMGDPWPVWAGKDSDERIEVARFRVVGVAAYHAYCHVAGDGRPIMTQDIVTLDPAVEQEAADHLAAVGFAAPDLDPAAWDYERHLFVVLRDTVRCIVAGWASEHPPEFPDWRNEHLGKLVNAARWTVGHSMPTGFRDNIADFRTVPLVTAV